MNCTSSERLFEAYLDDTLIPARRALLLAHLNGCGSCKGILEELRVVDALLVSPRTVELPENFTFATMADVRAMPLPQVARPPLFSYLVSFLAVAWLAIGAAWIFAWPAMHVAGETALGFSVEALRALGTIGHAGLHLAGDLGGIGSWVAAAVAIDVAAALMLVLAFARSRGAAQRVRS